MRKLSLLVAVVIAAVATSEAWTVSCPASRLSNGDELVGDQAFALRILFRFFFRSACEPSAVVLVSLSSKRRRRLACLTCVLAIVMAAVSAVQQQFL